MVKSIATLSMLAGLIIWGLALSQVAAEANGNKPYVCTPRQAEAGECLPLDKKGKTWKQWRDLDDASIHKPIHRPTGNCPRCVCPPAGTSRPQAQQGTERTVPKGPVPYTGLDWPRTTNPRYDLRRTQEESFEPRPPAPIPDEPGRWTRVWKWLREN